MRNKSRKGIGGLAQVVERSIRIREARGSIPRSSIGLQNEILNSPHLEVRWAKGKLLPDRFDMQLNSFAELGKVAHSAQVIFIQSILLRICSFRIRKSLSEVGFEPTPTFVDQNTPRREAFQAWVWRLRPLGHPDVSGGVTKEVYI